MHQASLTALKINEWTQWNATIRKTTHKRGAQLLHKHYIIDHLFTRNALR